jgi:hypothetical protein
MLCCVISHVAHLASFNTCVLSSIVDVFSLSSFRGFIGLVVSEKIFSMPSFGGEVQPFVPCHRSAACKRSLHLPWKSHAVGKI